MVQLTVRFPDEMAARLAPISEWLPTILELSFIGFKTVATAAASEMIAFLATNPSAEDVIAYHASETAQLRLQRLLALNEAGLLAKEEQKELDELQKLEHVVIMLKSRLLLEKQ